MNLYHLTLLPTRHSVGHEIISGFVIRAASESDARLFASRAAGDEGPLLWLDSRTSSCLPLTHEGDPQIILRDFNAK